MSIESNARRIIVSLILQVWKQFYGPMFFANVSYKGHAEILELTTGD